MYCARFREIPKENNDVCSKKLLYENTQQHIQNRKYSQKPKSI